MYRKIYVLQITFPNHALHYQINVTTSVKFHCNNRSENKLIAFSICNISAYRWIFTFHDDIVLCNLPRVVFLNYFWFKQEIVIFIKIWKHELTCSWCYSYTLFQLNCLHFFLVELSIFKFSKCIVLVIKSWK